MAQDEPDVTALRLLGGRLCIDFVNTVENRAGATPEDLISSYADLARWSAHAGLLDESDTERLLRLAGERRGDADRVLENALRLREALHRVLLAIARQRDPDVADLREIERAYERAVAHARLTSDVDRYVWTWPPVAQQLDHMLWPVAFSAIELLTEGELKRVKVCANPDGCGWLFYDGSKNASRRWCRMEGCGSQVKMRRQYAKRRSAQSAAQERE